MPYFGPIDFYRSLLHAVVLIDGHEHYIKQSLRNRCTIVGANGPQSLSIPIIHRHGLKQKMKDVRIDYRSSWQKDHWGAIYSAYGRSPYFIHYSDAIFELFRSEVEGLLEWNVKCHQLLCELLGVDSTLSFSDAYVEVGDNSRSDRRPLYRKHAFKEKTYTQVFSDRFSFVSGCSMLDVLFCVGPEWRGLI